MQVKISRNIWNDNHQLLWNVLVIVSMVAWFGLGFLDGSFPHLMIWCETWLQPQLPEMALISRVHNLHGLPLSLCPSASMNLQRNICHVRFIVIHFWNSGWKWIDEVYPYSEIYQYLMDIKVCDSIRGWSRKIIWVAVAA